MKPIITWLGGKRNVVNLIKPYVPKSVNSGDTVLVEPFAGGAALSFALEAPRVFLNDINGELINFYRVLSTDPWGLAEMTNGFLVGDSRQRFLQIGNWDRPPNTLNSRSPLRRAARFWYLNSVTYSGAWRVNKEGQYNNGWAGRTINYGNKLKTMDQVQPVADYLLNHVDLFNETFDDFVMGLIGDDFPSSFVQHDIKNDDPPAFFYFGPPYFPQSDAASLHQYYKDDFDEDAFYRLRDLLLLLEKRKIPWVLSNSNTPFTVDLFSPFESRLIMANQSVGVREGSRGLRPELLVIGSHCKKGDE